MDRLWIRAGELVLGLVLLLNTSDQDVCLMNTLRYTDGLGGVPSWNISTSRFLELSSYSQAGWGAHFLLETNSFRGTSYFLAPKDRCFEEFSCTSVYLMHQWIDQRFGKIAYHDAGINFMKLSRAPFLHAIVEPSNYTFHLDSYDSGRICHQYEAQPFKLTLCGINTVDAQNNSIFIIGESFGCV